MRTLRQRMPETGAKVLKRPSRPFVACAPLSSPRRTQRLHRAPADLGAHQDQPAFSSASRKKENNSGNEQSKCHPAAGRIEDAALIAGYSPPSLLSAGGKVGSGLKRHSAVLRELGGLEREAQRRTGERMFFLFRLRAKISLSCFSHASLTKPLLYCNICGNLLNFLCI